MSTGISPANTSRRTFVVGTAGHVDHGKSTLVRRLTGIDPDRLQEEKAREMTIDLGFAWLELPGGMSVSIVDVPGHERFIKNMLAGVGGLDGALLIVAADEGPMPQTREHLAILDLLGISSGVVVITKSDLVDDDWRDLVVEETREAIAGTTLAGADIVTVSAESGEGIDHLLETLATTLATAQPEHRTGIARLPVDRVFSIAGFGTVVTGTLLGAPLTVGSEVEIVPSMRKARVRGLQSHNQKVDSAWPGSRTAINLTGVERDEIQRGDVVTLPGKIAPTRMVDARLRLIADAPQPLLQNDPVDFFTGAAESPGYVTLLEGDSISPSDEGWVQIRLEHDIAVVDGDQFIVRQASPSMTIGGGSVLNAHPRRHRRYRSDVIQELETRESGDPAQRMLQAISAGPLETAIAGAQAGVSEDEVGVAVALLLERHEAVNLGQRFLIRTTDLETLAARIGETLNRYHADFPLREGMPREDVRRRTELRAPVFDALMSYLGKTGVVKEVGGLVATEGHVVTFDPIQQNRVDQYLQALNANPTAPPAPTSFSIDGEVLGAMAAKGLVVRLADNVVYSSPTLLEIRDETVRLLDERGELTLAEFRDHFGSSRRYAQAVLEYFDQTRVTRRVGDTRVRGSG